MRRASRENGPLDCPLRRKRRERKRMATPRARFSHGSRTVARAAKNAGLIYKVFSLQATLPFPRPVPDRKVSPFNFRATFQFLPARRALFLVAFNSTAPFSTVSLSPALTLCHLNDTTYRLCPSRSRYFRSGDGLTLPIQKPSCRLRLPYRFLSETSVSGSDEVE